MMSCSEAMGWGFWVIFEKKQLVEIRIWARQLIFESGRVQSSPVVCYEMRRTLLGQMGQSA